MDKHTVLRAVEKVLPNKLGLQLRMMASLASHSSLRWALLPLHHSEQPKQPPVLLVSLPRSGSSWGGDILSRAKDALYLREPMTQSYLRLIGSGTLVFQLDACLDRVKYEKFATSAFSGMPRFTRNIVRYPEQFAYRERDRKRTLIKEANPLVLPWIVERYSPKLVYLVRHPVPIANSYFIRGWTGDQFRSRFTAHTLNELETRFHIPYGKTFWQQSGAFQAITHSLALEALNMTAEHLVVRYEDLCMDPVEQFRAIFEFCHLEFDDTIRQYITSTTHSTSTYVPGKYDTKRDSKAMAERWKQEVDKEYIDQVYEGYMPNSPPFYNREEDWRRPGDISCWT